MGYGHRLARGGSQSGRGDPLHPVPRSRACRAASPALHDHPVGLVGASAQLQGSAGEAQGEGPGHLWFPGLPAAAGGGHSHLPRRHGAGGRRPGGPRGAHPRDCAALQPPLRPRARLRAARRGGDEEDGQEECPALRQLPQGLAGAGRRGGPGGGPRPAGIPAEHQPE